MYSALAKYYDALMADVDYETWVEYVTGFLGGYKHGIDFACGTGKFTLGLEKRGYQIYGVDQSAEMLNIARENARSAGSRAEFLQGDIQSFVSVRPVEFATVLCDGINYIRNLDSAFRSLYRALVPGGTLIFDISTEYKLKNILGDRTFFEETEQLAYVWRNSFSQKQKCVDMELIFFEREAGALYRRSEETQTQFVHTEDEVRHAVGNAGFQDIRCFGGLSRRAPRENTERIHFIAKKP